jgi:transcription elongation factor Elf1
VLGGLVTELDNDDWYKNHLAKKINFIIDSGESFRETHLYCPYCGKKQNDFAASLKEPDQWEKLTCEICEKSFYGQLDYAFSSKQIK